MDPSQTIKLAIRYLIDTMKFTFLVIALLVVLFQIRNFLGAWLRRRDIQSAIRRRSSKW